MSNSNSFAEKLEELIQAYEDTRVNYRTFINKSDNNKNTLLEFQSRFIDLKASLRPYHTHFTSAWVKRDDKSATAIKFRIAVAMTRGEYPTNDLESKLPTITNAEKLASGSKEYRQFIEERGFYRESLTNISDMRDDLNSYINEIKDRLKMQ